MTEEEEAAAKCKDLALYFIGPDVPHREARVEMLAQAIQACIEDELRQMQDDEDDED